MATLIAILISVLSSIVGMELYAWKDDLCDWLIKRSVERVLPEHQDRVGEEWRNQLGAFPNSLVRIWHALHIFLSGAATEINQDLLQMKFDKIDDSLNTLLALHQTTSATFQRAKDEYARAGKTRAQLQQSIKQSAIKFRTTGWPNGKPNEQAEQLYLRYVDSFEDLGNTLVGATARVAAITGMSIDHIGERLNTIGLQIENTFQKIARAKELLPRRNFEETSNLLKQLESDCVAISMSLEEESPVDKNAEAERIRILAAVEDTVKSLANRKPIKLKPVE